MSQPYQYRPRTIYLSSESVNYFTSSERVTVPFSNPIIPEEGFHLAYGLSSIGMNSTVMNISEIQKNNRLQIKLFYSHERIIHLREKNPITGDYYFIDSPTPEQILKVYPLNVIHTIIIPDGLYTFELLLDYLTNYTIPSGHFYNLDKSLNLIENMVPLKLIWQPTVSGYNISIGNLTPNRFEFINVYDGLTYIHFTPKLERVQILPDELSPGLYNKLFTNFNAETSSIPISSPPSNPKRGINPPYGIEFILSNLIIEQQPDIYQDNKIKELGNESIYDGTVGIYPLGDGFNSDSYVCYYRPSLHPVYVDIQVSLPNSAIDERGASDKIARIFTLGSKIGNESFFQAWSNPKMTSLEGISGFSSLTVEFKSQENLYNFFNLDFSMEIFVCELRNEEEPSLSKEFSLPATDMISNESDKIGPATVHPFPQGAFPYRAREVQTHKRTRFH